MSACSLGSRLGSVLVATPTLATALGSWLEAEERRWVRGAARVDTEDSLLCCSCQMSGSSTSREWVVWAGHWLGCLDKWTPYIIAMC